MITKNDDKPAELRGLAKPISGYKACVIIAFFIIAQQILFSIFDNDNPKPKVIVQKEVHWQGSDLNINKAMEFYETCAYHAQRYSISQSTVNLMTVCQTNLTAQVNLIKECK